jgi:Asp-tRNA(Asn)/Glu-tRNA(Gln) amidotransferase A subunit family amidase
MATPPVDLSARDLSRAMRRGDLSARAVAESFLRRIDEREPSVKAWAWLEHGHVLEQAARADALKASGEPLGPLHGLPVGVKDIIDTFDMPTECGTPIHKGRRPAEDAVIVARLRAAGAIILGKTVTSELAVYSPGPTRNPHDLTRTPGGSSSGSAAAVASGMAPVALGTQTNGSVIRPASFCGVVGYKPSLGLLPRTGVLKQASELDQPGVMARSVADAAFVAAAMMGRDVDDEASFDPATPSLMDADFANGPPPKLAFVRGPFWQRADLEARHAIEAFVGGLATAIEPIDLPDEFAAAEEALGRIMSCGVAQAFHDEFAHGRASMSDLLVRIVERGRTLSAVDLLEACAVRERLRRRFQAAAARYDAILTPSATGAAPPFSEGTGNPIFSTIWTLLGAPAITLPLLQAVNGMPIGVQLVGRDRDDARLLRTAAWLERISAPTDLRRQSLDVGVPHV